MARRRYSGEDLKRGALRLQMLRDKPGQKKDDTQIRAQVRRELEEGALNEDGTPMEE